MIRSCAVAVALAVALVSGASQARGARDSITDNSPKRRPESASVLAYVPWYHGLGFGLTGRFEIPVVHNGFIRSLNNSFSIEPSFGVDWSHWGPNGASYDVVDITPAVYGVWTFYISREFNAYGGLGLGFNVGIVSGTHPDTFTGDYFYWDPVVGIHYKVSRDIALRAEAGAQGLKGGVTFYL